MSGGFGDDTQSGGPGDDTIFANRGRDTTSGGPGNDHLWALARADVDGPNDTLGDTLRGDDGDDVIRTRDGEQDVVNCGAGNDRAILDFKDVIEDATADNPNGSCELRRAQAGAAQGRAQRGPPAGPAGRPPAGVAAQWRRERAPRTAPAALADHAGRRAARSRACRAPRGRRRTTTVECDAR